MSSVSVASGCLKVESLEDLLSVVDLFGILATFISLGDHARNICRINKSASEYYKTKKAFYLLKNTFPMMSSTSPNLFCMTYKYYCIFYQIEDWYTYIRFWTQDLFETTISYLYAHKGDLPLLFKRYNFTGTR